MSRADTPVAAIDVGSGMTKFIIGIFKYQHETKTIEIIKQVERPVPYGVDWKRSTDGNLSEDIQAQGIKLFKEIIDIIENWKESYASHYPKIDVIGVGTEVFRKANNGAKFLKTVENQTGLRIELIPQQLEAKLGFLTGRAAILTLDGDVLTKQFNYDTSKNLVVYDSGGGSFQITWTHSNNTPTNSSGCEDVLNTVLKPSGLAPTLYDLLELQMKDQHGTPNPVSYETAIKLVDILIEKFIDPVDIKALTEGFAPVFLSIGGINSHVRLAADILIRIKAEEDLETTMDYTLDKRISTVTKFYSFTEQSVTLALKRICGKEDRELEMFAYYENAEPVSYMVPKMCILLSVLKGYKIPKLNWIMSCGSCFGLILNHIQEIDIKNSNTYNEI